MKNHYWQQDLKGRIVKLQGRPMKQGVMTSCFVYSHTYQCVVSHTKKNVGVGVNTNKTETYAMCLCSTLSYCLLPGQDTSTSCLQSKFCHSITFHT